MMLYQYYVIRSTTAMGSKGMRLVRTENVNIKLLSFFLYGVIFNVESSNIIIYERALIPVRYESYPDIVILFWQSLQIF